MINLWPTGLDPDCRTVQSGPDRLHNKLMLEQNVIFISFNLSVWLPKCLSKTNDGSPTNAV